MVMVLYDDKKELEALRFQDILIWIRVFKLSMGMMKISVAEIIDNEVEIYIDADVDESESAAGSFLRIKMRIDIAKPMMRGVTIDTEREGDVERWCPFEYEFLPELCHYGGIIGHVDKSYTAPMPIQEGQFGKWLHVVTPRRKVASEMRGPGKVAFV
jgi:hypothetical protein